MQKKYYIALHEGLKQNQGKCTPHCKELFII